MSLTMTRKSTRKGTQSPTRASPRKDEFHQNPPVLQKEVQASSYTNSPSRASQVGTRMFKQCTACKKGNQLAVADRHEECISCLGFSHLYSMKTCLECQAFSFRERFERARRLAWWQKTGNLLSANGMRRFIMDQSEIPQELQREQLQQFFVITQKESEDEGSPQPVDTIPQDTIPTTQACRTSLLFGATPVASSKPHERGRAEDSVEEYEEEEYEGAPFEEPSYFMRQLAEDMKSQKETADRDRQQFLDMFGALQDSISKLTPQKADIRPVKQHTSTREMETTAPLSNVPITTPVQKVTMWTGFGGQGMITPEDTTSHLVTDDYQSVLAQPSVDDTPYPPRQLTDGHTQFDWDYDGTKYVHKEDVPTEIKDRIAALEEVAKDMVDINDFPQESQIDTTNKSKILGTPTSGVTQQEVVIPLPQDVKEIISAARNHKTSKSSLLPPTVRKGYRIPRHDWAALGAVRRPDKILEAYCRTKKSAKGVHQLQDHHAAIQAAFYQDTAQATAHTIRPMALSYQSAATMHDLTQQAQEVTSKINDPNMPFIEDCLTKIAQLARYTLTAAADSVDCVARLNADALKRLRAVWLDQSKLPDEVKDAVKASPITSGTPPTATGVEFTTPIAGEVLKQQHDMACARAKAEQLLYKKAGAFRRPLQQKRRGTTIHPHTQWKRFKPNPPTTSYPARQGYQPQQKRGASRGGRGGHNTPRGGGNTSNRGTQGRRPYEGRGGKSS